MRGRRRGFLLLAALLLAGLGGCFLLWLGPKSEQVEILQEGQLLYRLDLQGAKDQSLRVEYQGGYNLIELKEGQIRVVEASCPDKTCVKMGSLNQSGLPIVCLPHRLVIQYASWQEPDGIAW